MCSVARLLGLRMSNVCRKCAMVFGSSDALKNHLATAHGIGGVGVAKAKKAPVKKKVKTEDK